MGANSLAVIEVPTNCKIYTPSPLACGIVSALGDKPGYKWLEPSFGQGAFLKALSLSGVEKGRIVAIDLDREPSSHDYRAQVFRGVEFLSWSCETPQRFDRVVGNPPYVPMSRVPNSLRRVSEQIPIPYNGQKPNGSSNLWFFFLCASIALLRKGGSIGFVLPAAWEYADYAEKLRESVAKNFSEYTLIRSRKPLFPEVQEGSVVLLARGFGNPVRQSNRLVCDGPKAVVEKLKKMSGSPDNENIASSTSQVNTSRLLGEFVHIGIGAVTGDVSYFLLTDSKRTQVALPVSSCIPVLTRARQLTVPLMSQVNWERLRDSGERVWLFRPSSKVLHDSAVKSYLSLLEENGGCNRSASHISRRSLWYETPIPKAVHGFVSGMATGGPCIIMNKMPKLAATNTLYVVSFKRELTMAERYIVALGLLSSVARSELSRVCRIYASGLRKHEPRDFLSIPIPIPNPISSSGEDAKVTYRRATKKFLAGEVAAASEISDSFFRRKLKI